REHALPLAYAALKPLFAPEGIGLPNVKEKKLLDVLPLVRLVRADRVTEAVRRAQHMARAAGLSAPFADFQITTGLSPDPLAAALLFPIAPATYKTLIERAYPASKEEDETDVN